MDIIKLSARTDSEGKLKLDLPTGASNAEVLIIVAHPHAEADAWFEGAENEWPPGFFEQTAGSLADDPLEHPYHREDGFREPYGEVDQLTTEDSAGPRGWPPGFLERVVGGWKGDLVRGDQGEYEVRDELP